MKDEKESVSGGRGATGRPSRARNHTVLLDPSDMAAVREKLAEDIKRGFVETAKEAPVAKSGEGAGNLAPPSFISAAPSEGSAPPSFLPPLGAVHAEVGEFGSTKGGFLSANAASLTPSSEGESVFGRLSPGQSATNPIVSNVVSETAPSLFGSGSFLSENEDVAESSLVGRFGEPDFGSAQMDPFGDSLIGSEMGAFQGSGVSADSEISEGMLSPPFVSPGQFSAAPEFSMPAGLSGEILDGSSSEQKRFGGFENPVDVVAPSLMQSITPVAAIVSPVNMQGAEHMSNVFNSPVIDSSKDRIVWKKRAPLTGFLVSYDNDENGEWFPLQAGRLVVTSENDPAGDVLIISSETVSPSHAILKIGKSGEMQVLDQLSEYGTRILRFDSEEEEELSGEKAMVSHGDVVQFGERSFYVVCVERD